MIIIEIQGGLGNQLFLYVYWKWMIKTHSQDTIYGLYPSRALADHNGLEIEKWFDVDMPKSTILSNFVGNVCFWMNKVFRRLHLPIPYSSDDSNPRYTALFHDGYYQDLKYQEEIELPSFKYSICVDEANIKILNEISKKSSICVHVRRGDYHKNATTRKIYGDICTLDYYQKAITKAKEEIENPNFFFFSDDMDYVRESFDLENSIIVDINKSEKSFFDMYLMAHAGNMILANSTFSCWAAYLNKNVNHVYCPPRWVNIEPIPNIIKPEWTIIHQ